MARTLSESDASSEAKDSVLVVDDNAVDREAIYRLLRGDYQLFEARTAAEGLDICNSEEPDCVLLDYTLPDSKGTDALEQFSEFPAGIVVLTGRGDEEVAVNCLRAGAHDYLSKRNLSRSALDRALRNALGWKRARKKQEQTEQQLRAAQRMEAVGRLAGGVAHDFNNILTAIFSFGDFVLNALEIGSPAHEDMVEVLHAAERAQNLTQQLLAFSRRQNVKPQVVNMNQAVVGVERLLRRVLSANIDFETSLQDDLWNVKMDPASLEQVVLNLVMNARDAMEGGGRLVVETENKQIGEGYGITKGVEVAPGSYVAIAVSDNGTGMDTKTQSRIFEPFFTTKDPGKGTGLGLATCYGIVKQANGFIWVYSEENVGSTFRVLLPRVLSVADAPVAKISGRPLGGTETILLTEDEAAVRKVAARALSRLGYTVLEASTGQEAIERSKSSKGPIDLLLTDMVMPSMGGASLAEQLSLERPSMQVLFMSGYTENVAVRSGIRENSISFLEKPFTPAMLGRRVREVLDEGENADVNKYAKILCVDDNLKFLGSFKRVISKLGQVDLADGGPSAYKMILDKDYDLILCDLVMPTMSGLDLFEVIVKERPGMVSNFVLVSGNLKDDEVMQMADGASLEVVAKPLSVATVERMLSSRGHETKSVGIS